MEVDNNKAIYPVKRYSVSMYLYRNLRICITVWGISSKHSAKAMIFLLFPKSIFFIGTRTNRSTKDSTLL